MRSDLFDQANVRVQTEERFALQNDQMLRVGLGPDLLAAKGAMVAYVGNVEFRHEKAGMAKLAKKIVTSEDVSLMRVSGEGEVYFAADAGYVFLLQLEGEGISLNVRNLLAFDAALDWDINRVKGAGIMTGGFFNTTVHGHGAVAVSSVGKPVVFDCSQQPIYVDPNSAVCWSANLVPTMHNSMHLGTMLRGGTGEDVQYVNHGPGIVAVQAYEWTAASTGAK